MKKTRIHILYFLAAAVICRAQDFHVSHYDVTGMYLNPAVTGIYGPEKPDYRVYLDHRSQWKALGIKPYTTSYLGYDMFTKIQGRRLGFGGYLINNNTGINNLNTVNFMVSASYDIINAPQKTVSRIKPIKQILTIGIQMGLLYRSVNPNNLSYDVQYSSSTGTFDRSVPNQETHFNYQNMIRFDAAYGLYYKYLKSGKKFHPYAGFSMFHLNKPRESMTGTSNRLPIRHTGQLGCDIKLDDDNNLKVRLLYMNQARSDEFISGILYHHKVKGSPFGLAVGIDYRLRDAGIFSLAVNNDSYAIRLSYDVNVSFLQNYLRRRGAIELSLIYSGEKGKSIIKSFHKQSFL